MNINEFVGMLADLRLPAVFNPYSDTCAVWDLPDAPARRRANLEAFLNAALETQVSTLWVGRDLGYRGGRRTGIALTDEPNMSKLIEAYGSRLRFHRATKGPVVAERTASVVWDLIRQMDKPVFTWNVFPLHPHPAGDQMGNRCHTVAERTLTAPVLRALIDLLKPTRVVAIGNDASVGLRSLGIPCAKVRHPSYGGITDFRNGIATLHSFKVGNSTRNPQFSF